MRSLEVSLNESGGIVDTQGKPDWNPSSSLQEREAWKAVTNAVTKVQRDAAIDKWLEEALSDLEISLWGYRKSLLDKSSPTKQLRRKTRQAAAEAMQELGSLTEIEAWYRNFYHGVAQEWRQKP